MLCYNAQADEEEKGRESTIFGLSNVFIKYCGEIKMEEMTQPVKETPLLKRIILYTIPIILTGFLQLLFNAADLVVVGHYRGSISVGAVGATGSIINLVVNLFMGLSVGAGVRVAHGIGAQNDKEIHRTVHTSIPTAVIRGIILTVIGVVF